MVKKAAEEDTQTFEVFEAPRIFQVADTTIIKEETSVFSIAFLDDM